MSRSGRLTHLLEPGRRLRGPHLGDLDEHQRRAGAEVGERTVSGVRLEPGHDEQRLETAQSGDPGVLATAGVVVDDDMAVDVGERARALAIWIAGERSGWMPAQQRRASERPHRRVGFGLSQELSDRLAAKVVNEAPGDQLRASWRQTSGSQTLNGAPCRRLAGIW